MLNNRRIRWSIEAKVLKSAGAVAEYLGDLKKYVEGVSAPFATQAALGAYLLDDDVKKLFATLAKKLDCKLKPHPDFASRPHRCSEHKRSSAKLPQGMPREFICHHLAFELA